MNKLARRAWLLCGAAALATLPPRPASLAVAAGAKVRPPPDDDYASVPKPWGSGVSSVMIFQLSPISRIAR
jgi:hypothetical protein